MISPLRKIGKALVSAYRIADQTARGKAVETLEHEVRELDHILGLLIFGAFVGMPMPPAHLSLSLLPVMEKELDILVERLSCAHDPLGELFSVFSID